MIVEDSTATYNKRLAESKNELMTVEDLERMLVKLKKRLKTQRVIVLPRVNNLETMTLKDLLEYKSQIEMELEQYGRYSR